MTYTIYRLDLPSMEITPVEVEEFGSFLIGVTFPDGSRCGQQVWEDSVLVSAYFDTEYQAQTFALKITRQNYESALAQHQMLKVRYKN